MTEDARDWDGTYWRALTEATPDLVLVVDLTGTILFVNRVVPVFADRGVVGRKIWEFAVGDDAQARLKGRLQQVVETRKAVVYENRGIRSDGSQGWYEVRAIPVNVDGKIDRILWASTDISDRVRLEEQLRQSQKMEAVGLLAGGVAHDFNNLLAVIMGFADLAARGLPPGHSVTEQLGEVVHAARRGGELTHKLLAFSRKQIIQPRRVDLGASIEDFAKVMRRLLGADLELVVEPSAEPMAAIVDPVQLEQVLMNLWTNARQAMPNGGELRLSMGPVEVDAADMTRSPWARGGSFVEIRVKDTGVGMDEKTLARVFEPFFTTKRDGTGLGLSTVYGIVQQHGGFVNIESALGAGTTVSVFLPRATDGSAVVGARAGSYHEELRGGGEVILLAEDEPALRSILEQSLAHLGYRVIAARDGEEAARAFEEHAGAIDLVVLDVVMPHLDARGAYERMRAVRPDVKVVFTTGYAPDSTRMRELLAGREMTVLQKPFAPMVLAAMVRRVLGRG